MFRPCPLWYSEESAKSHLKTRFGLGEGSLMIEADLLLVIDSMERIELG